MFECRYVARIFAAVAMGLASAPALADTIAPGDLVGWWLSIDDVQPQVAPAIKRLPAEELLVVDASGRAYTRMMVFYGADPRPCSSHHACSDAPLLQHTTVAADGDLLTFQPVVQDDEVPDFYFSIDGLRSIAATSTPAWLARLSGGGKLLFLEQPNGSGARAFARVDPGRLGRIRAAYPILFGVDSKSAKWRCFLAHATAGDPAFLPLYHGERTPPPWFPDFVKAASYFEAVSTAAMKPPPGATERPYKQWSEAPLTPILIERFPDTDFPKTEAESNTLRLKALYLQARLDGMDDAAARSSLAGEAKGETITLSISEEEAATLAKAKTDPQMRETLACP
jgi:hypothetical protein